MERRMKKILILLAMILVIMALAGCGQAKADTPASLNDLLAAEGSQTIKLTEDLVLTEPLVVNGDKIITGGYTITLNVTDVAESQEGPGFSLLGCPKLTAEDWSADAAVLQVAEGAALTLEGDVVIDGAGVSNGVVALKGATVNLTENATVKNGLNCGIYICEEATLNVSGGSVLTNINHGVVNMGTMNVTGGTLSGAEKGAVIYSAGKLEISEGSITAGGVHNVYVAAGSANVTGGKIDWAEKDGIVVASGASATVTGGAIENCGTHGLCNGGTMDTGAINLYECGIANQAGGTLNMTDTTVEVSPVYCLANMGGTVTATNFTTLSCDVTSICNFAGDMTLDNLSVSGSRAGNISNESGNLTVNNATLGLCREKPINVGSGVVRMDNITVEGTTGEYFGAYIYGGEFYLNNSSINFINYSALRADGQCYVELNNVSVDDTMASGIWARGATIVANKLSLNNVRGHAVRNSGGNITIHDMKATNIGKEGINQDNGETHITDASFQNVDGTGAYVKGGKIYITRAVFDDIGVNGVYNVPESKGGNGEVMLKDVVYSRVKEYGLNNGYIMGAQNVKILCDTKGGIHNKKELWLQNVEITAPKGDGIYNDTGATITAVYVTVDKVPSGKTGVFNRGAINLYDLEIKDSDNGMTNKETGFVTGDYLTIVNINKRGIYNQGTIDKLNHTEISNTGSHGINNEKAVFNGSNLTISDVHGKDVNAIYNTGDMNLTTVTVNGGESHSVFNRGNLVGTDFTINDSAQVSFYSYDDGVSDITNLTVNNSANHAVCNISEMSLTNLTVNGTTKGCGLINGQIEQGETKGKSGTLELNGEVILNNTASHGLANVQNSTLTGAANVTINNLNNTDANSIYNRGSTMTVNNIASIGDKYGVSNTGTLNAASIVVEKTTNNGIHNTGTMSVSDDVTISDVYGTTDSDDQGNGIYNAKDITINGKLAVSNITSSGAAKNTSNNAICNKGNLTVNGNVDIGDVKAGYAVLSSAGDMNLQGTVTVNGVIGRDVIIQVYSSAKTAHFGNLIKTSGQDKNILLADGSAQVTVDQATLVGGSKDIVLSKGTSATTQATVTLKNATVTGGNGNAMHAAGGAIVLENVTISGAKYAINSRTQAYSKVTVKSTVTLEKGTNVPVYVQNGSTLEIADGAIMTISANGKNAMMLNASGSTLKMGGGSVLNIDNCNYAIHTVGGTVYNGSASSVINANTSKDTAIMLQGTGSLGTLNITNSAKYGLSVTGTANVQLAGISVNGAKNNGFHSAGVTSVSGDVSIAGITGNSTADNEVNSIYNTKTLNIGGNLTIADSTATATSNSSGNGIFNKSVMTVDGTVSIGNAAKYAILQNGGSIGITGALTVNGTAGGEALVKVYGGAKATFGAVNKTSSVDKIVVKADSANTVLTINGGSIKNGSNSHVIAAYGTATINVNDVTISGGKYGLDAEGGNIVAQNVSIDGSNIGMYAFNATSNITLKGTNTVTNTTHGTSVHVKGKLIIDENASLTISKPTAGMKVYANATLELKDNASLIVTSGNSNITLDSAATVTRGTGAVITVNGQEV